MLDVSDCHLSLSPLVADNVNNRLASDKRVHESCKPNKRRLLKERNLEKCPGRAGQASHSKTWSDEKSYKRNYKKKKKKPCCRSYKTSTSHFKKSSSLCPSLSEPQLHNWGGKKKEFGCEPAGAFCTVCHQKPSKAWKGKFVSLFSFSVNRGKEITYRVTSY